MADTLKFLEVDPDGMMTYDYIVNNVDTCIDRMDELVDCLLRADKSGQFLASSVRFLNAVDPGSFHRHIGRLVMGAIDRDRERRYIGSLLEALWGQGYRDRAAELAAADDNFRRIYKRIYPDTAM